MLNLSKIRRAFNRAAKTLDENDVLLREVAERLVERLPLIRIQPQRILECGAGTGYLSRLLSQRYPHAELLALDFAEKQLAFIPSTIDCKIASHYAALPFQNDTFDMIVSSLALHWTNDLVTCLHEFQRVLRPNGLLIFTLLGVETLKELRDSFASCREYFHRFPDMHDVGDCLLHSRFENPVMDMETITISYKKLNTLFRDFKLTGTSNAHQKKMRGLFGKNRWEKSIAHYETLKENNAYPATFEIIYGHAWQPIDAREKAASEVAIPIDRIF